MHRRTRVLTKMISMMAVLVFLGSLALAAPSPAPAAKLTVGDFLLLYAHSIHFVLPPSATPATAYEALKAAKAIPSEPLALDSPLTHGDIVRIGRAAGLRISSSTPAREFGRAEADLFLETFGSLLQSNASGGSNGIYAASDNPPGDPVGHANTNKGSKKGRPFQSPDEPE